MGGWGVLTAGGGLSCGGSVPRVGEPWVSRGCARSRRSCRQGGIYPQPRRPRSFVFRLCYCCETLSFLFLADAAAWVFLRVGFFEGFYNLPC